MAKLEINTANKPQINSAKSEFKKKSFTFVHLSNKPTEGLNKNDDKICQGNTTAAVTTTAGNAGCP